jgi:acetoin utilization deacetylase AcuC-like enzyme
MPRPASTAPRLPDAREHEPSMSVLPSPTRNAHDRPHHPECPDRLRSVLKALDAGEFADLIRDQAPQATREQLMRVHPENYVDAILASGPSRMSAWRWMATP